MNRLANGWRVALHWIETGDLILPVIIVSAAHYAQVLAGRDFAIVAFVIGVLVDLGHYRVVKAAIRYSGLWWGAALIMSALAFGFHFAFYQSADGDWREYLFSVAVPIVIVFLAALSVRERWAGKSAPITSDAKPAPVASIVASMSRQERLADIRRVNLSRNGDGAMTPAQVVAQYDVSLRQAQRDVAALETHG